MDNERMIPEHSGRTDVGTRGITPTPAASLNEPRPPYNERCQIFVEDVDHTDVAVLELLKLSAGSDTIGRDILIRQLQALCSINDVI
jgi:hypothetical protein